MELNCRKCRSVYHFGKFYVKEVTKKSAFNAQYELNLLMCVSDAKRKREKEKGYLLKHYHSMKG